MTEKTSPSRPDRLEQQSAKSAAPQQQPLHPRLSDKAPSAGVTSETSKPSGTSRSDQHNRVQGEGSISSVSKRLTLPPKNIPPPLSRHQPHQGPKNRLPDLARHTFQPRTKLVETDPSSSLGSATHGLNESKSPQEGSTGTANRHFGPRSKIKPIFTAPKPVKKATELERRAKTDKDRKGKGKAVQLEPPVFDGEEDGEWDEHGQWKPSRVVPKVAMEAESAKDSDEGKLSLSLDALHRNSVELKYRGRGY